MANQRHKDRKRFQTYIWSYDKDQIKSMTDKEGISNSEWIEIANQATIKLRNEFPELFKEVKDAVKYKKRREINYSSQ